MLRLVPGGILVPADRDMDVAALAPEMLVSQLDRLLASLPELPDPDARLARTFGAGHRVVIGLWVALVEGRHVVDGSRLPHAVAP
jgi:hypothetical protein